MREANTKLISRSASLAEHNPDIAVQFMRAVYFISTIVVFCSFCAIGHGSSSPISLPCWLLVSGEGERNGLDKSHFRDVAKKVLNVSRHAADGLLEHPVYGPVFRRILHVAEWIGSREGQAVCKRTAELLNEDDLATARKFTAALEEEYKPNEILLNCRRARAAVRENTGEIERNRLLDRKSVV